VQRAHQTDGKRHRDAEFTHHHTAVGIIERRQRIHHRNPHARAHHRTNRRRAVRLQHQPALHALFMKQRIQQLAIAVGARQADVVFSGEILRCQHCARAERMLLRQNAHLVAGQQRQAFRTGRRMLGFGQAEIVALRRQPLLQQRRLLRNNIQADVGIALHKGLHQRRQQRLRKDRQAGDGQLPLTKLTQPVRRLHNAIQPVPRALHLFEQAQPLHCGLQPTAHAREEP
jgi:hypothetical protein